MYYIFIPLEQAMQIYMLRKLQPSQHTSHIIIVCNPQLAERILFLYLEGTVYYNSI